jgi:predicted RNase H-like HicB family nuclease
LLQGMTAMERVIQLHIEKLPEGAYLATSDDVQGLVAQGRTIQETIEIARDVAKKLIEAQSNGGATLSPASEAFDFPLIIAT